MTITMFLYLILGTSISADGHQVPMVLKKWESLEYKNIPANKVSELNGSILIDVNHSASPLIYTLKKPTTMKSFRLKGQIKGDINLSGRSQGEEGADDFLFRLGLVYEGGETLSFFQRLAAPNWVKKLYSLKRNGSGISNIHFYNLISDPAILGKKREHPLSDLLIEHFSVLYDKSTSSFRLEKDQLPDTRVLAFWISVDGDDTRSKFSVVLKELSYKE